jgi:beta-N-acetylhexosaminidase
MKPAIFGTKTTKLTAWEKDFFKDANPLGFILFARNIESINQVKELVAELKEICNNPDLLFLIDEEGGRVTRTNKVFPEKLASSKQIGDLYQANQEAGLKLLEDTYQEICSRLLQLDLNCCCTPILDLYFPDADKIIGDRAFAAEPELVINLANRVISILKENNILPIIKHIPGHGRANCDSHLDLPEVDCDLATLKETDFLPFKALAAAPFAMTAHIIFTALDPEKPVTLSKKAIAYLRQEIGYKGLIMTDDLSMKALQGDFATRTKQAIAAGCDIILHCNGDQDEMIAINNCLNIKHELASAKIKL